jgi:DNA replication protein DnaC
MTSQATSLPLPSIERAQALLSALPDEAWRARARPVSSAMPGIQNRDAECTEHGAYTERGLSLTTGTKWHGCPQCAQMVDRARATIEARQRAEKAMAAAAARAADAVQERLGLANIPPRLLDRSFAGYVADNTGQRKALAVASRYAESFGRMHETGFGLVFLGGPGTGKGHLAAAIMLSVVKTHRVQYLTAMDLFAMIRDTWRRTSEIGQAQVVKHLGRDVDLLVVDEVGLQSGTEGEQTLLAHVLDHRYLNKRPTIIISNLGRAEFRKLMGDRMHSRLSECASIVEFGWDDYRPTARREAFSARGEA